MKPQQTTAVHNPVAGLIWMIVTGLLFVCVTALVKLLGPRIPAAEAAFLRYALGLVLLLPLVVRLYSRPERPKFTPKQWQLFTLRGLLHTVGVSLWFYAMARIPMADVTAMNYLTPVYVTLGAAVFLGERLAMRRIIAVLVALIGAIIILRPGFREVGTGHLAMLIAAVFLAGSYLIAKILSDQMDPKLVVLMMSAAVTAGLAPLAAAVWIMPSLAELAILCAVALAATLGHYTMTLAFRAAPVTVTQPVTFLQLIWAVILGAVMFAEPFDVWVIVGGLVILGSATFITWRESRLKSRIVAPPFPATKV